MKKLLSVILALIVALCAFVPAFADGQVFSDVKPGSWAEKYIDRAFAEGAINGNSYDAKSVMFLMSACIKCGSEIELVCEGPDEEKALAEISEFIESGMGD